MGEWKQINGRWEHLTQTRSPDEILKDMRNPRSTDHALQLCRELPDAMNDHGVIFYAP